MSMNRMRLFRRSRQANALFRLATHVEFAQRMRQAVRDHRVAVAFQRHLEPVQRLAIRLGLR